MDKPYGIVRDLPFDEYAKAEGISQTALKLMARSAAHCHHYLTHGRETTPALKFGSLFDRYIFDAPAFASSVCVRPEGLDGRTKDGKKWLRDHADYDCITREDFAAIKSMHASLNAHKGAASAMMCGHSQVSIFAPIELGTGEILECKARPDFVPKSSNAIIDLKTTEDARPEAFARDVLKYGYHIQAALYLDLWNAAIGSEDRRDCFVFVCVEKEPPYAVAVYNLGARSIEHGRETYMRLAKKFCKCKAANNWPAYSEEIEAIEIPEWGMK